MLKKTLLATTLTAGLLAALSAQAGSSVYDPRSLAMGGVGITTATARNASFLNPAALAATKEDEDFAFNVTAAVRAADPDKLIDDIDSLETTGDALTNAYNAFNLASNDLAKQAQAGQLSNALAAFKSDLSKVNNKAFDASAFAGTILAIPSKKFGIALHAGVQADFGAKLSYRDSAFFDLLSPQLAACSIAATECVDTDPNNVTVQTLLNSKTVNGELQLDSRLELRGIAVSEVGLSLARRFEEYGGIDIGLTPKMQKVKTFNQSISAQNAEIDLDRNTLEASKFNLDVGVTKSYGDRYKAGLVITNLINNDYDLAGSTEKIRLERQVRLGVSHHTDWTVVGLDADLTKKKGLNGFSQDSQFVGLGAELDVWLLQLRVGYRHDLSGNYDGMASVGLGLNLFGLHLDLGAAGNENEGAASLQIGLNF
jgi:hypothetical protein